MYVSAKEWLELQRELLSQRQQYADLQVRVLLQAQIHNDIVPILQKFDNMPGRYEFMVRVNKIHQANWRLDFLLDILTNPFLVLVGFPVLHNLYKLIRSGWSKPNPTMEAFMDPERSSIHDPLGSEGESLEDPTRLMVLELKGEKDTLISYDPKRNVFAMGTFEPPGVGNIVHGFRESVVRNISEKFLKLAEPGIEGGFRREREGAAHLCMIKLDVRPSTWVYWNLEPFDELPTFQP